MTIKYTYKTYGTAKTFKSEGDMYEYITGRRSKILDEKCFPVIPETKRDR